MLAMVHSHRRVCSSRLLCVVGVWIGLTTLSGPSFGSWSFCQLKRGTPYRPVAFLGDSITRGVHSAPWIDELAKSVSKPPANFGQDGLIAEGALQLVDEVVSMKPAVVVVFVGTNDFLLRQWHNAGGKGMIANVLQLNGLEPNDQRAFTARAYGHAMKKLLDRLMASGLPTLVVAPPMLGEAKDSEAAQIASEYVEELRAVVKDLQSSFDDVTDARFVYFDFSAVYLQELEDRRNLQESREGPADDEAVQFKEFTPAWFVEEGMKLMPNVGLPSGRGPGPKPQGLDVASAKQGFWLKPDLIHFNERCASVLSRTLQPLLKQILEHSAP